MRVNVVLAGVLSVSMISISGVTASAADLANVSTIQAIDSSQSVAPISVSLDKEQKAYFNSFTGTVKKITAMEGVEGSQFVSVENEAGAPANFIVSKQSYILNNAKITVGSKITGYYKANVPMIMIYPPQYHADVVIVDNKEQNVKVDLFDQDLLSSDQWLKLNISKDTEVVLQDGTAFAGELTGRKLVVMYDVTTKSIPAQTTPTKIIVLKDETSTPTGDVSGMDIVVNNKKIKAPAAYTNEKGTVMVPLRAIAEALGYEVTWDGKLQSVMLGKGISLKIGVDNYTYMKTAPIHLGTAPTLIKGTTFVPLSFFKEVVRMNNAYVFESQIVIDNGEIMK